MTIYQVIDDLNRHMFESYDLENAQQEAEILNMIYVERYFFVEETEINVH
jgi:hypothetical protein